MSISKPVALGVASFFLFAALGCSKPEPVQPVDFYNGRLSMSISDKWVLQRDSGNKAYYRYGDSKQIKLSFEDQTRDFGVPMTVRGVRSAIGTELNLRYGSVTARIGYGGTAVLSYEQAAKDGRKKAFTQNWVVAHPLGYGAVARVAITLKVPDGEQGTPEFQALVEALDKQVGDAKMPEA